MQIFSPLSSFILSFPHTHTQFKDSGSAERAVQNLNDFEILDRKIKVTLVTDNPGGSGGAMELLDGDEFQGGVGLTLQSRASLMAKLAETHNVGEFW